MGFLEFMISLGWCEFDKEEPASKPRSRRRESAQTEDNGADSRPRLRSFERASEVSLKWCPRQDAPAAWPTSTAALNLGQSSASSLAGSVQPEFNAKAPRRQDTKQIARNPDPVGGGMGSPNSEAQGRPRRLCAFALIAFCLVTAWRGTGLRFCWPSRAGLVSGRRLRAVGESMENATRAVH